MLSSPGRIGKSACESGLPLQLGRPRSSAHTTRAPAGALAKAEGEEGRLGWKWSAVVTVTVVTPGPAHAPPPPLQVAVRPEGSGSVNRCFDHNYFADGIPPFIIDIIDYAH